MNSDLVSLPVRIVYIGNKPFKKDTVAGTRVVWRKFGDVQIVPNSAASILLQHKNVWVEESDFKRAHESDIYMNEMDVPPNEIGDIQLTSGQTPEPTCGDEGGDEPTEEFLKKVKLAVIGILNEGNEAKLKGDGDSKSPKLESVREALGEEGKLLDTKTLNAVVKSLKN